MTSFWPPEVVKLYSAALAAHQQGKTDEALRGYEEVLKRVPDHPDALAYAGVLDFQGGRMEIAFKRMSRAVEVEPTRAAFHDNIGVALTQLGQPQHAVRYHDEAIRLDPQNVYSHYNMSVALRNLGRPAEAVTYARRAYELAPQKADLVNALALALAESGAIEEAIEYHKLALRLDPNTTAYYNDYGNTLLKIGNCNDALIQYHRVLKDHPNDAVVLSNLACTMFKLERFDEALAAFEKALMNGGRQLPTLLQACLAYAMVGEWSAHDSLWPEIKRQTKAQLAAGQAPALTPFFAISYPLEAAELLDIARAHAQGIQRAVPPLDLGPYRTDDDTRLRIGFLSADFSSHAVGFLLKDFFAAHDRSKVEIHGFSIRAAHDDCRTQIEHGCDHFHDLSTLSFVEAAKAIHALGIHCLADLTTYTAFGRPEIMALRPAPVQFHFLGFPGTTGAPFMDYYVTHESTVPPELRPYYTERMVYLPDTFIAINGFEVPETCPTRHDLGLPEDGIVFCCFNSPYRIDRATFSAWMRVLKRVPGSVLWLNLQGERVVNNLRRAAKQAGVAPERLIIRERVAMSRDWAHRQADIWLDTPISAGTAGILCLWAGLPVVSVRGKVPAHRTGTAVLTAGLASDLLVDDWDAFVEMAVALANDPERLHALKARLLASRHDAPLFKLAPFMRRMEDAYRAMWEAYKQGREGDLRLAPEEPVENRSR